MHDQMTPKERIEAFYSGKEYDRIPTAIFMSDHMAGLIGATAAGLQLSADTNVKAQIAAYRKYNTEEVGSFLGVGGVAEALGAELIFPEQSTPYIKEPVILDYRSIDAVTLPSFHKAGRYPMFLEIAQRLLDILGEEVPVCIGLPGPFTTAGSLRGTENFMRDLYYNPEFAHKVLRLSLDATMIFVNEAAKLGVSFSIGEPTASGSLISLKQFREFAFPYLKELIDNIKRFNCLISSLHICGNTKKMWDDMVDTGAGTLSLDERIDLAEAKNKVGAKAVLMGNIPPTDVMLLGIPSDVEDSVKDCINKAYDSPGGYILGLGCGMPKNTTPENIYAFYNAARKYGKYPLKPAN